MLVDLDLKAVALNAVIWMNVQLATTFAQFTRTVSIKLVLSNAIASQVSSVTVLHVTRSMNVLLVPTTAPPKQPVLTLRVLSVVDAMTDSRVTVYFASILTNVHSELTTVTRMPFA